MKKTRLFLLPASLASLALSSCGEKDAAVTESETPPAQQENSPKDLARDLKSPDQQVVRDAIYGLLESRDIPEDGDPKISEALAKTIVDFYAKEPLAIEIKKRRVAKQDPVVLRQKACQAFYKWAHKDTVGLLGTLDQIDPAESKHSLKVLVQHDPKLVAFLLNDRSLSSSRFKELKPILSELDANLAKTVSWTPSNTIEPILDAYEVTETLDTLLPQLSETDPKKRLEVVRKISAIASISELDTLQKILTYPAEFSDCWPVAMRAIIRVAPDKFERSYMQHATDIHHRTRLCGEWTIPGRTPVDQLLQLLKNSNIIPVTDAAYVLGQTSTSADVLKEVEAAARKHPNSISIAYSAAALASRVDGSSWSVRLKKALDDDARSTIEPLIETLSDDSKTENEHTNAIEGLIRTKDRITTDLVDPAILVKRYLSLDKANVRFRKRDLSKLLIAITPPETIDVLIPLATRDRAIMERLLLISQDAALTAIKNDPKSEHLGKQIKEFYQRKQIGSDFIISLLKDESPDVYTLPLSAITRGLPHQGFTDPLRDLTQRLPEKTKETAKLHADVVKALHSSMNQRIQSESNKEDAKSAAYAKSWNSVFTNKHLDLAPLATYVSQHTNLPEGAQPPLMELDYVRDFPTERNKKQPLAELYLAFGGDAGRERVEELIFNNSLTPNAQGAALYQLVKLDSASLVTYLPEIQEKTPSFFEGSDSANKAFVKELVNEPLEIDEKAFFPLLKTKDQAFLEAVITILGQIGTKTSLAILPKILEVHSDLDTSALETAIRNSTAAINRRNR